MPSGIEIGFALDRRWSWMKTGIERSKHSALLALAEILDEAGVAYALIGGTALQHHRSEPRTTLDIDVAVLDRAALPVEALSRGGFVHGGAFAHSDNWVGPEQTPVQFTDDPALAPAVSRAEVVAIGETKVRVIRAADLLREKLRAGADPARRRSKRLQDLVDAQTLLEDHPELEGELGAAERALLARLP